MSKQTTSAAVVAVAFGLLGIVAAACGTSSGSSSTTTSASTTSAPSSATVSVPISVSTDSSGVMRGIVRVEVGGGPSVPVLLDTGSAGLRILPKDVGSGIRATGQTDAAAFGGGNELTSTVVATTVTIAGVSTSSSTKVSLIQSSGCATGATSCTPGQAASDLFEGSGAVGILGIAMADGSVAATPIYSPLLQLSAPFRNGFTLSLPIQGTDSFTLGTPTSTAATVTLPLQPATPSSYPNGMPAWQKDVDLCWTLNDKEHGCGSTDLDLGNPQTVIAPGAIPGLPSGATADPGLPISVTTAGGQSVWSYTATNTPGQGLTIVTALPGTTQFNTGIGIFTTHMVGYDAVDGRILVTPL